MEGVDVADQKKIIMELGGHQRHGGNMFSVLFCL
jgi:hypothetical protein